jgi:8-oxo-dGTP pyrophosphatase MutT (NUDIX family)
VLLLKRAATKKLLPNLITGIGGKVEFDQNEAKDLEASLLREFTEETKIDINTISGITLKLSTIISRDGLQVVLLWYVGQLNEIPQDLSCTEGELGFYDVDSLPLEDFTPTASKAIPFILSAKGDKIYNGVFKEDGSLVVNE